MDGEPQAGVITVQAIVDRYAGRILGDPHVIFGPTIPPKVLWNALEKLAPGETPDNVLLVVDNTLGTNAHNGALVTKTHLHTKGTLQHPVSIALSSIESISLVEKKISKNLVVNDITLIEFSCPKTESLRLFCQMLQEIVTLGAATAAEPTVGAAPSTVASGDHKDPTEPSGPSRLTDKEGLRGGATGEQAQGSHPTVAQPSPGWLKFETESVVLWLPDSYVGGDPGRDLRAVVEQSTKLGALFQAAKRADSAMAQGTTEEEFRRAVAKVWDHESKKKVLPGVRASFRAFDSDIHGSWHDWLTAEVMVFRNPTRLLDRRKSLLTFLSETQKAFPSDELLVEQSIVRLGQYEAVRRVVDSVETPVRVLLYAIKGNKEFWYLSYTAPSDDWDRLLPVFETSAATLQLKEVHAA